MLFLLFPFCGNISTQFTSQDIFLTFFAHCNPLICSVPSCRWTSHDFFRKTGCRDLLKPGERCNAPLLPANDVSVCDLSKSQSP